MFRLAMSVVVLAMMTAVLPAQEGPANRPPAEFQLQFGGKAFDIRLDEPMMLRMPDGTEVPVMLTRKDSKTTRVAGVAFEHPSGLETEVQKNEGFTQVNIEGPDSLLVMLQVYEPGRGGKAIHEGMLVALRQAYGRQYQVVKDSDSLITRTIAGQKIVGQGFIIDVKGVKQLVELFVVEVGDQTTAVVLQHEVERRQDADRVFKQISGSLRQEAAASEGG